MSTTFLQQILSGGLLQIVISGQKNNLSIGLTIYSLEFVM